MIIKSEFEAPGWARNRHLQTIWPRFFMKQPRLNIRWQQVSTSDGDFLELAWLEECTKPAGLAVIFHGLEGSVNSHYAAHLMKALADKGWNSVLVHFRGCGPQGNNTARSYHSGETQDNHYVLNILHQDHRYQGLDKVAIGFSLGGNMLLKMMGEFDIAHIITKAYVVSPPFDLASCAHSINQGFSKVYQKYLLKSMCQRFLEKAQRFDYQNLLNLRPEHIAQLNTFYAFDDCITGPLHGFDGADHYYQTCSAKHFLSKVNIPTLVLHSRDDPFMSPDIVPEQSLLSDKVKIELSETGGHVGFMLGSPTSPRLWVNERIISDL